MKPIGIAILGGGGYGAGELLRLLARHPYAECSGISSTSSVGRLVNEVHRHLLGEPLLEFSAEIDLERLNDYQYPVVVAALPHGASSKAIEGLFERGLSSRTRIVDLSGDLRLTNREVHHQFYPDVDFAEVLRSSFVYGLPEIRRSQIVGASRVANPGCLATASILALAPIANLEFEGAVVLDVKTGTSGAGRSPQATMHHPGRHGNFEGYKILCHRHEPEILQALNNPQGERFSTMFVPHLLPIARGIYVTAYVTLKSDPGDMVARYRSFYSESRFIRLRESPPALSDVIATNFCDVGIVTRGHQVVVMVALDNLVKGMAGQAIQNINLMCGVDEDAGLTSCGLGIV